MYDKNGVEIHCLKSHEQVTGLDFLPYHFLLVSLNETGRLTYQDISTGKVISNIKTHSYNPLGVIKHNPKNGVVGLGTQKGVVSLWSPVMDKPLAKLFADKAPITDLAWNING